MKISSWAIFRARHHKTDTFDEVRRLGSIDEATPQSERPTSGTTLADGWTESDRHIDKAHILELDFTGQSEDLQASIEKQIRDLT